MTCGNMADISVVDGTSFLSFNFINWTLGDLEEGGDTNSEVLLPRRR